MARKFMLVAGVLFVISLLLVISFYPDWNTKESEPYFGEKYFQDNSKRSPNYQVGDESHEIDSELYMEVTGVEVGGASLYAVVPRVKRGRSVLLLHGAAFSSRTWERLKTIDILIKANYHPVAVDLPGYGESSRTAITNRNNFLSELIKKMGIEKPVIVSPSMSGRYSIPHLLHHADEMSGFVPISPVIDPTITPSDFKHVNVSTLIIYGERDKGATEKNKLLSMIPGSKVVMIPNAEHPCYLDDPILFHNSLLNFLKTL
uniref:AB hydrolase-1 domain-containing protein n=1 Tax=Ciona savignyi TaxID=51511 RepID=H2YKV0_CIOSA